MQFLLCMIMQIRALEMAFSRNAGSFAPSTEILDRISPSSTVSTIGVGQSRHSGGTARIVRWKRWLELLSGMLVQNVLAVTRKGRSRYEYLSKHIDISRAPVG